MAWQQSLVTVAVAGAETAEATESVAEVEAVEITGAGSHSELPGGGQHRAGCDPSQKALIVLITNQVRFYRAKVSEFEM